MWLCVITAVEKKEMLLNHASGNPDYCLHCSAVCQICCVVLGTLPSLEVLAPHQLMDGLFP